MTPNIEAWDRISARSALPAADSLGAGSFGHDVTDADFRILGDVAGRRLLVQPVELEQGGVVGPLGQALGAGNGGIECGLEVGHGKS